MKKVRKRPAAVTAMQTLRLFFKRCVSATPRGWKIADTCPSALRTLNCIGEAPNSTMNLVMKLLPMVASPP